MKTQTAVAATASDTVFKQEGAGTTFHYAALPGREIHRITKVVMSQRPILPAEHVATRSNKRTTQYD